MLADVDPRDFDEWVAFRRIEPDPDERLREILKLGISAICGALGHEVSPETVDPWNDAKSDALAGPGQAAAAMKQRFSAGTF